MSGVFFTHETHSLSVFVFPFSRTPQQDPLENTTESRAFDEPYVNGQMNFERDNPKTLWRHWCKTIFSICSALCLGEQGTTPLNLQLGECAACGSPMYPGVSTFSHIEGISNCTKKHQVLHRPCCIVYTVLH